MRIYYITGTSSGIGEALANALLTREDTKVIGVSRRQTIHHPNYTHIKLDLSDVEKVERFYFELWPEAEQVVLVNNAGTLGNIGPTGSKDDRVTIKAMHVNLVAPMILTNQFFRSFCAHPAKALVINISSGAGQYPVDGWSSYCTSKAGIDMFSKVTAKEMAARACDEKCKIFSIAPGIVDTAMQDHIRNQDEVFFSRVEEFRAYKRDGKLASPEEVAQKLLHVIDQPDRYTETVFRLE